MTIFLGKYWPEFFEIYFLLYQIRGLELKINVIFCPFVRQNQSFESVFLLVKRSQRIQHFLCFWYCAERHNFFLICTRSEETTSGTTMDKRASPKKKEKEIGKSDLFAENRKKKDSR